MSWSIQPSFAKIRDFGLSPNFNLIWTQSVNLRQSCDNRVDVWLIHGPMTAADFMTCQTIKNLRQLPNTETFTYVDFYGCKTI